MGFKFEKQKGVYGMKKKLPLFIFLVTVCFTGCNITNKMGNGDTPLPSKPTHVEFYNGGACIASYDNAVVYVSSVHNSRLVGANITWYYYEVVVNGEVIDTIIDSESLAIKYKGSRRNR